MSKILVIGACGQIGIELTLALRIQYGRQNVIAADLRSIAEPSKDSGPFISLDVLDKETLHVQVRRNGIDRIYLLAAMLSASGEQHPQKAWQLNMQSLLNTLEVAREEKVKQVFWPSSIAVFGPDAKKDACPQEAALHPATVYGISKLAGEQWCSYYHRRYGLDVRSLRYPGLISYSAPPGGGTTDYAVNIFHAAKRGDPYTCFLNSDTRLPMMYMHDAIRATIELMAAPVENIKLRTSYNISAMSFTPAELAAEIKKHIPGFRVIYDADQRQAIADSWPASIDDLAAFLDWDWQARYDLKAMVVEMLGNV